MASISLDLQCIICLQSFQDPVKVHCGHTFCRACIQQCFQRENPNRRKCPTCKAQLPPDLITDYAIRSILETQQTEASSPTFQYREIDGDLMQCPSTDSMAISMNKSFYMSSGVAKQFQEQFGRLQELKSQNKKVGEVAVLEDGKRYLYYMITRSTYSYKPRYEDLEKCLQVVKAHCVENKVVCLSMPRIGSGRDKLEWSMVSNLIRGVFWGSPIHITIYNLPLTNRESQASELLSPTEADSSH
ncbi:ADP-ribose glycohydrolase OARD1-like isoform X2 [Latimeria chalumnae]|uniref:ADP-ribose glycohydrolase OARD1-like isoform X2 n=1 Tax=Latimeria chalumnae TaxID=7897 RepID=UPI00313E586A